MIRPLVRSALVLSPILFGGCGLFAGDSEPDANAPLVALVRHRAADGPVSKQLLDGLDDVRVELLLNDKGYRAVPASVTETILRNGSVELPPPHGGESSTSEALTPDALEVFIERGVDYLLLRDVSKDGLGADFRLRWSLVDVLDGSIVWATDVVGGPGRVIGTALVGPAGLVDEPQLSDDVRVGRGLDSEVRAVRTETIEQQAREANERIADRLPRR